MTRRLALPPALAAARSGAAAPWARLAGRERRLVLGAVLALALLLVWLVGVQPAWRTLRSTPAQLDAVDLQLQQMQRLAAESRELRSLPPVPTAQAEQALRAASERLGPNARLTLQGERATLTLNGVAGDALSAWLGEARTAARARPDEARLALGPNGYTGSVTLSLAQPR